MIQGSFRLQEIQPIVDTTPSTGPKPLYSLSFWDHPTFVLEMHWAGASLVPILPSGRSALQSQATVEVRDGVMAMRVVAARTNHSKPETAIPLKDQDRLCTPLAMAIQQGHTELFSDLRALGALA